MLGNNEYYKFAKFNNHKFHQMRKKVNYLISACRPTQWSKNLIVFAAPLFTFDYENNLLWPSLIAFLSFCLISSAIYLLNDCIDIESDRNHPTKYKRPIAAGHISKRLALLISFILSNLSIILALIISRDLFFVIFIYLFIQICYCLLFKKRPLLDLFCISSGFLLRSFSGLIASNLFLSPWFILSVGLLSLFLAVEKRKAELLVTNKTGIITRTVLNFYSLSLLSRLESTLATSSFICYSLWAAGPTLNGAPTSLMLLTTPLVLIGIFRYQLLSDVVSNSSSGVTNLEFITEKPELVLLKDNGIRLIIFTWIVMTLLIGLLA